MVPVSFISQPWQRPLGLLSSGTAAAVGGAGQHLLVLGLLVPAGGKLEDAGLHGLCPHIGDCPSALQESVGLQGL